MNRPATLAFTCLLTASAAFAQFTEPPPIPPAPPIPMQLAQTGHPLQLHMDRDHNDEPNIAPPGTWWRNPETIKALNLTPDQQKKLEETFRQSRIQLIDLKASLEKEQLNLEPLLDVNPPDTGKAMSEISKIADLRADLEKANARMLLGLRAQLTAEQWTRLQAVHTFGPAFTLALPRAHSRNGEARNTTTTTCTQLTSNAARDCTTTTVTEKEEAGHRVLTTCTQNPGQTIAQMRHRTHRLGAQFLRRSHPLRRLVHAPLQLHHPTPPQRHHELASRRHPVSAVD